jgi:hypothetical protein
MFLEHGNFGQTGESKNLSGTSYTKKRGKLTEQVGQMSRIQAIDKRR